MNTDDLVQDLARNLEPVAPLRRPGARAGTWFVGAALYVALLAIGMGLANGYSSDGGLAFWAVQIAAIVTSLLASTAAFASVVPGLPNRWRGATVVAVGVWLIALVATSPAQSDWSAFLSARHEWWCVAFMVAGGAPLLAALAWVLRRGAPLRPVTTAAFAALSVAALANVGACVSLPHPNNAVTLTWHGAVIVVSVLCAAACGRLLFDWRLARPSTSSS
jgi:hypothetical protein